jgi:hypothetical protein
MFVDAHYDRGLRALRFIKAAESTGPGIGQLLAGGGAGRGRRRSTVTSFTERSKR